MATRIHVTAVHSGVLTEVRAVFTDILGTAFEAVPVHEQNGWVWFTTSVWGVKGSDLNAGLCRLALPALQFTTSDDARWHLTVHGGALGREDHLHEFTYFSEPPNPEHDEELAEDARNYAVEPIDPALAFLEDEPETPPRPRMPFDEVAEDFDDCGAPLPESLVEKLRALSFSEAVVGLHAWHVEAVVKALTGAGIDFDVEAVTRVLQWDSVTRREHYGGLGNLPRLLSVLGLGGQWDEYVRAAEDAPDESEIGEEDETEPPPPPPDYAREVLEKVGSLALVDLDGEAVPLKTQDLRKIGFASEACSTWPSPMMAISVSLPEGGTRTPLPKPEVPHSEVYGILRDSGFRVGLLNRTWCTKEDLEAGLGAALADFLLAPPDGAELEADFAVEGEPATYQRFRGAVSKGTWRVSQSWPRLSSEALAGLITVAAFEDRARVTCRDEAEAMAIEQAARKDNQLHNMGVRRESTTVSVDFDHGNLAKLLLRHRYPHAWDFQPAQRHEAEEFEEQRRKARAMRKAGVEAARRRAIPHERESLFRGRHSWYFRSDIEQLTELEPEPLQRFDIAMDAMGFVLVGDLVAKKQRDILLHVFVSGDRMSYGVLMAKRTMYLNVEFVSRLSNGAGLTTTTNVAVQSVPEAGVYYRSLPGLTPEALCDKHLEGLERFRKHKDAVPVELGSHAVDVACEIEMAFERLERG